MLRLVSSIITCSFLCHRESELLEVFKGMDKDGSGHLSPDEIKAGFANLDINISDSELSEVINDADKDGDGKISYKEFLAEWAK